MSDLNFSSKTHFDPTGAWTENFSVSGAMDRLNYSLGANLNPEGFQGGSLSASTSLVLNEEPEEETSDDEGSEGDGHC